MDVKKFFTNRLYATFAGLLGLSLLLQGFHFIQTNVVLSKLAKRVNKQVAVAKQDEELRRNPPLILGDRNSKLIKEVVNKVKRGTVTISMTALQCAYMVPSMGEGTGVIIDKKKGLILTNAHVAQRGTISKYKVECYDGTICQAKVFYCDPSTDIAILVVAPAELPAHVEEVKLSQEKVTRNLPIFIVGNNEGQGFSIHQGTVVNLHEIVRTYGSGIWAMPTDSIVYSLNTHGGSSGSGVFTMQGEMIALNFAGGRSFGNGVKKAYLSYIIAAAKKGKQPVRRYMGTLLGHVSLNKISSYIKLDKKALKAYQERFPQAQSKALIVKSIIKKSPAEGILNVGDIIIGYMKEDGTLVRLGPSLVCLELAMNRSTKGAIQLRIRRVDQELTVQVPLRPMPQIKRMVSFGGALFFEADSCWASNISVPSESLSFFYPEKGSSFWASPDLAKKVHIRITHMDEKPVTTLNQLIALIPSLVEKKYFVMRARNSRGEECVARIEYQSTQSAPLLFTFNNKTHTWDTKILSKRTLRKEQRKK